MAKTYQQLQQQIETLRREAESARTNEIKDVIARIRKAIDVYGLTAADLGLAGKAGRAAPARPRKAAKAAKSAMATKPATAGAAKFKVPVKYRDAAGNTWTGRGSQPRWLREALQAGRTIDEFAV